jgi:hypothetical protein
LAKDGGGWHCLAVVAAELAELVGEDVVAQVTANPPSDLRSPVAWLLARTRQLRDQARGTATTGAAPQPPPPASAGPANSAPQACGEPIAPTAEGPPPGPGAAQRATSVGVVDHQDGHAVSLSPVPRSERLSEALTAVAGLTVAGAWREQLAAAARGELVPTRSTVRLLAHALADALHATPDLTGRGLVLTITNRPMPSDVKDLPGLLAARAQALTATKPRGNPKTAAPPPAAQRDRGCAACDGARMVLDGQGTARPCPTCAPQRNAADTGHQPRRRPDAGDGPAHISSLLPHLAAPDPGGTNQCKPTVNASAS